LLALAPAALLLISAIANLVCLGVLGSLTRSGVPGLREAVICNVTTIASLLLFAVQAASGATSWLLIVPSNLLYSLGTVFFCVGVCRFLGRPSPWRWLAVALGATVLVNLLFLLVWPSGNVRIVAASGLHVLIHAFLFRAIWRALPGVRVRYSYWFTLGVVLFGLLGHTTRVMVYLFGVEKLDSLGQSLPWNAVFLALGVLIIPALLLGFIMMIHDRMLTDREREADTDFLTGLLTRKAWWRETERLRARAAANRGELSILIVDLDHFKQVNDRHGHSAGDAVLRHFATLAGQAVREGDMVGRMGGEEFALAFLHTSLEQAGEIGNRLQQALRAAPCAQDDLEINCTFSGGLARWRPGESLESTIKRADRALYAAKEAGRAQLMRAQD
jgi:diguanylate cyclase (GGDEF)-like protein